MLKRTVLVVAILACLVKPSAAIPHHSVHWHDTLYTSATNLSATGNTGIIATPALNSFAAFTINLEAVGDNMATDETNTLTIDWYTDSAGTGGSMGTTTFAQLTAGAPVAPIEAWPGDVTGYTGASNAPVDAAPFPPYMKITYTLAGTTKSMGFTLFWSWWRLDG